jgi:hypothetical protein
MKKLTILFMAFLLVWSASAFEIVSPENETYNSTTIDFIINHNESLDNITYVINGNETLACENCSDYNTTLELSIGTHTINAFGISGNNSYNDSVTFTIEEPVVIPDFSIEIVSPENMTYNTTSILLSVTANETLDIIRYKLDNSSFVTGCENCSSYNETLNVSEGDHELVVEGTLGNITVSESVMFFVELPDNESYEFTLEIVEPEATEYEPGIIEILVEANRTLDSISLEMNGYNASCENCSGYNDSVNLSVGNYTLTVTGILTNVTKNASVSFSVVEEEDNETEPDDNESEPRFSLGFNKLPQAVANGGISDAELAEIIRNNKLNPGILNRLIKTGMLGNESLEAILDTQFKPMGILRKLLAFIGFKQSTYASEIYENYELSNDLKQKLVVRDDLPPGQAKKLQQDLSFELQEMTQESSDTEEVSDEKPGNSLQVGKQNGNWMPPGQAKKINGNGFGKNNNPGKGKGKNK